MLHAGHCRPRVDGGGGGGGERKSVRGEGGEVPVREGTACYPHSDRKSRRSAAMPVPFRADHTRHGGSRFCETWGMVSFGVSTYQRINHPNLPGPERYSSYYAGPPTRLGVKSTLGPPGNRTQNMVTRPEFFPAPGWSGVKHFTTFYLPSPAYIRPLSSSTLCGSTHCAAHHFDTFRR